MSWFGSKAVACYTLVGVAIGLVALALDWIPTEGRGSVLARETVEELRSANGVRPLMYEQQDVNLKRVSKGSYGAALARVLDRNARLPLVDLLLGVTLQRDVGRWRGVVEVHKTGDGRVMIVGYVDGGTAARLADESESVGNLFLHHEHEKRDWTAVAIPASRIVDWDYRSPHEFSEIEVD